MLRFIRLALFVAIGAVLGAVAGRVAAEARRRSEAGEDPGDIDFRSITLRPQDLVPGIVAAVRVRDRPWSWLHIPSAVAAFGVNFGVAAVGGDLSRFREMAERAAFNFTGIQLSDDDADEADLPPSYSAPYATTVEDTPPPRPAWGATSEPGPAGFTASSS